MSDTLKVKPSPEGYAVYAEGQPALVLHREGWQIIIDSLAAYGMRPVGHPDWERMAREHEATIHTLRGDLRALNIERREERMKEAARVGTGFTVESGELRYSETSTEAFDFATRCVGVGALCLLLGLGVAAILFALRFHV